MTRLSRRSSFVEAAAIASVRPVSLEGRAVDEVDVPGTGEQLPDALAEICGDADVVKTGGQMPAKLQDAVAVVWSGQPGDDQTRTRHRSLL